MASGIAPHNLAALMEAQLTARQLGLLREVGRVAQELGLSAYLVGGPVRDLLLGRPSDDCDLVVAGEGLRFAEALAAQLDLKYAVHERFLTAVMQLPGGGELDVATARREKYEFPGALPVVEPASLDEDLGRRDFSINALAVALDEQDFGQLCDPCGGYADLQESLVRVLHDGSFRDDPTRIVRAVGFEVKLGFRLELHTESLLKEAVTQGALTQISPERCREVLLPLLATVINADIATATPLPQGEGSGVRQPHNTAVAIIVRLGELGVLAALGLGEVVSIAQQSVLQQAPAALTVLAADERGITSALVYLSLLAYWAGTDASRVAARIHLTGDEQKAMDNAIRYLRQPPAVLSGPQISPSELYFALEGLSIVSAAALWTVQQNPPARSRIEEFWHHLRTVTPDIDGDDLIAAGAQPGPQFATALREALRVKLDEPEATARQQLAAALAHLARAAEM